LRKLRRKKTFGAAAKFVKGTFASRQHCANSDVRKRLASTLARIPEGVDVRFGSKANMCAAKGHIRFTPNSDRKKR
jgi:hypothetical protein